jgi:hypothetical protein
MRVLQIDRRGFFLYLADTGKPRAPFQRGPKPCELIGRANRVCFDAAIGQVAHVAAQTKMLGFALREIAKADALHESGDKETLCLLRVSHKLWNCSRAEPPQRETQWLELRDENCAAEPLGR